jgi:hypothetical protein
MSVHSAGIIVESIGVNQPPKRQGRQEKLSDNLPDENTFLFFGRPWGPVGWNPTILSAPEITSCD